MRAFLPEMAVWGTSGARTPPFRRNAPLFLARARSSSRRARAHKTSANLYVHFLSSCKTPAELAAEDLKWRAVHILWKPRARGRARVARKLCGSVRRISLYLRYATGSKLAGCGHSCWKWLFWGRLGRELPRFDGTPHFFLLECAIVPDAHAHARRRRISMFTF